MHGTTQLLDQPVERAARLVALDLLASATKARARLDDPADADALHHFRVSLRRLRSWLRVLRPWLAGSVPKPARKRLEKAAHRTSDSRDAEVHLAWLNEQRSALSPRQRHGWKWLVEQIETEKQQSDHVAFTKGTRAFDRAAMTLSGKLPFYRAHVNPGEIDAPPPFALVLAQLIRDQGLALAERLTSITSFEDARAIHAARLAGKRLRYLVEPVADSVSGGRELVASLGELQDALGNWHDVHVFSKAILDESDAVPQLPRSRPNPRPAPGKRPSERDHDLQLGLFALAGRLQERGERGFAHDKERWLTSTSLAGEAEAVAQALAALVGRSLPVVPSAEVALGDGRVTEEPEKEQDDQDGGQRGGNGAGKHTTKAHQRRQAAGALRRVEQPAISESPGP
jgi:CHAD domain-containing protein